MHDDLVALVDRMLELNKRLAPIRNTPSVEREELLREIKPSLIQSVQMEGEERGVNHIINRVFTFTMEGLYWFNIYLDESLLTRIPLRTKYNRIVTSALPPH